MGVVLGLGGDYVVLVLVEKRGLILVPDDGVEEFLVLALLDVLVDMSIAVLDVVVRHFNVLLPPELLLPHDCRVIEWARLDFVRHQ